MTDDRRNVIRAIAMCSPRRMKRIRYTSATNDHSQKGEKQQRVGDRECRAAGDRGILGDRNADVGERLR